LKNVIGAADARQKTGEKARFIDDNEHFEPVFNAAVTTQIIFQQPAHVTLTAKTLVTIQPYKALDYSVISSGSEKS
jgi:hypothetical protein